MFTTITLETSKRGIARLMLNRPEKHHAFNALMISELHAAIRQIDRDPDIHVVILGSSGPIFCAGGDLRWMQEQMGKDRAGKIAEAKRLSDMLIALDGLSKPVIAQVQGNAFGGGVGLCCVADIVVAADSACFALTETRLGLLPATIGPFIYRRLGYGRARQIFITGSHINALRALQLGLISFAVPNDHLEITVEAEAETALKAGPNAMAAAKALLGDFAQIPGLGEQIEASISALADCWETPEANDAIAAFFKKAPAPWIKKGN